MVVEEASVCMIGKKGQIMIFVVFRWWFSPSAKEEQNLMILHPSAILFMRELPVILIVIKLVNQLSVIERSTQKIANLDILS